VGLIGFDRRRGIAGQEGVDQDVIAVGFDVQTSVTQPADACGHVSLPFKSLERLIST
jgi:hypothetical protein